MQPPSKSLWIVILGAVAVCAFLFLIVVGLIGYVVFKGNGSGKNLANLSTRSIEALAAEYVVTRPNSGLVIGCLQHGEKSVKGFGRISAGNRATPDEFTIFEIGSITKVFTGITLAQMTEEGSLRLDDPIRDHLPKEVALWKNVGAITLEQLATHSSGLPRLPSNVALLRDWKNPYANYGPRNLYSYLSSARLKDEPGNISSYSNLGFGLLGHVLELKAGEPYEEVVKKAICTPLALTNTTVRLDDTQRQKLAPGHNEAGKVYSNWDFDALAGCGALRSNAADLLKFLEANLQTNHPTLGKALVTAQETHFKDPSDEVGLGWQIQRARGQFFLWHNGGTGGYGSFIAFDPAQQTAVVLLSNASHSDDLDQLGIEILKRAANSPIWQDKHE
jgi:serine-type D-Ala-D-Ala carboxypeptidase/endopeptidase